MMGGKGIYMFEGGQLLVLFSYSLAVVRVDPAVVFKLRSERRVPMPSVYSHKQKNQQRKNEGKGKDVQVEWR
jgi:hypothetical protein